MKDEAAANAETDRKAKEEIDKLNHADTLIFQTEKQLKEYGDKVPADKREKIKSSVEELKTAHKNKDLSAIDAAMEKLNSQWQAASEEMYKNTQQPGSQQPGGDGGDSGGQHTGQADTGKDPNVTDVDFEEVKDDKK